MTVGYFVFGLAKSVPSTMQVLYSASEARGDISEGGVVRLGLGLGLAPR